MAKPPSSDKKGYHHGDLKQALLDETARILREEGESALSLRALAANLGVSRTAPYNHFENKQSLLCAIAEEGFARFNQTMQDVRDKHRGQGGEVLTRALVRAYLDFARNNQEYYDLMYGSDFWRSGKLTPTLKSTARGVLRQDIERLKRGQQRGLIAAEVDAVQFSQMYWGTLHGISRLLLDGVFTDTTSLKKLCDSTAAMLWQQLDPTR
ncbi:TetR family transcriptional regulator [Halioglobus japonicus]|uniref:TetR/AcrR family transcriptional regulator n=1 Tax=Halioglobus japonicus TaxID=930805 RepID=A0AAP8MGL6_9GAMM|nr:TetR/AcrR family transcriptional regulator [Halioglobus japonicus]PLW87380.1 TetR/AcrR family transcriptional regulator [Halioglobus japonicus]GHD08778.1 TetR family transcriptional regulator [Halioglobus japonicus]